MNAKYMNVLMAIFVMMIGAAVFRAREAVAELLTLNILTEGAYYTWFLYLPSGSLKEDIHSDVETVNNAIEHIICILYWLGSGSFVLGFIWLVLFCIVLKSTN